ncbi:hypothetical protein JTB14_012938 [Gonioctena quinquepunctata]|nr:hypothetical protein JTB14_012938 [Gonioctena quinquepunctata]
MKVIQIVLLLVFIFLVNAASGIIRNDDQVLIGEEDRRAAEKLKETKDTDQVRESTAGRGVWVIGQNEQGHIDQQQHGGYGSGHDIHGDYSVAGPDNLAHSLGAGGLHGYNTRPHHADHYGPEKDGHGYGYPPAGVGLSQGHSGGEIEGYGQSGGGLLGYDHGGENIGQIGVYGHSGGGVGHIAPYGHIGGGGLGYEHGVGGHNGIGYGEGMKFGLGGYEHGLGEHTGIGFSGGTKYGLGGYGGYGLSSIFGKKLPLKKLFLPIAGLALLGAAAALTTNPVLLQLGTISGRKKRSTPEWSSGEVHPKNPFIRSNRL